MLTAVTVGLWLVLAVFVFVSWSRINAYRLWRIIALGLALLLSLSHQLLYSTMVGDAYVTLRYARHLAEGHGAVYNPGEFVEGYSNFLWVLLVALPGAVFGDSDVLVTAAIGLGVLCVLGCVVLAYRLTNRIVRMARPEGAELPGLGVVAAGLTAGVSSLAAYGPSGVEAPLFVLLVLTVCLALFAGRAVVAGVAAALAVMTRPEGSVVVVIGLVWFAIEAARGRRSVQAAVAYLAGAAVLVVPWTVWRLTVYEHLVPNVVVSRFTGAASARLAEGWDYLAEFALAYQAFIALAVAALALLSTRRGVAPPVARARAVVWWLFALAVALTVVTVVAGGGWLPVWRLLTPVPVLLAVAGTAAYGLFAVSSPATDTEAERGPLVRRRTAVVAALALCGLSLVVTIGHPYALPAMRQLGSASEQLAEIGTWLDESLPAGTVISTHNTGALAYAAGSSIVVVDVYGRTDEHIARAGRPLRGPGIHAARDTDYVISERAPALAVQQSGYTRSQRCDLDPAYSELYEVASFRKVGTSYWFSLYVRAMPATYLVERLDEHPDYDYVSCS